MRNLELRRATPSTLPQGESALIHRSHLAQCKLDAPSIHTFVLFLANQRL